MDPIYCPHGHLKGDIEMFIEMLYIAEFHILSIPHEFLCLGSTCWKDYSVNWNAFVPLTKISWSFLYLFLSSEFWFINQCGPPSANISLDYSSYMIVLWDVFHLFLSTCVCVSISHVCEDGCRGQKRLCHRLLQLHPVVSCLIWALGTKFLKSRKNS